VKYVALGVTLLLVAAVVVGCGAKTGAAKSNAYGKAIPRIWP